MLHKLDLKNLFKQKVQELRSGKGLSPRLHPSHPLCYMPPPPHCGCCRRQGSKAAGNKGARQTAGARAAPSPGLRSREPGRPTVTGNLRSGRGFCFSLAPADMKSDSTGGQTLEIQRYKQKVRDRENVPTGPALERQRRDQDPKSCTWKRLHVWPL